MPSIAGTDVRPSLKRRDRSRLGKRRRLRLTRQGEEKAHTVSLGSSADEGDEDEGKVTPVHPQQGRPVPGLK